MASGSSRAMFPFQPRQSLPPQRQMYQQSQKGNVQPTGPAEAKARHILVVNQATSGKVVTCIILVHSAPACVLFDSDATRCFTSSKYISKHSISFNTINEGWTISTSTGMMSCNQVCRRCPVVICCKEFLTNFLMIDRWDFDIILGMH